MPDCYWTAQDDVRPGLPYAEGFGATCSSGFSKVTSRHKQTIQNAETGNKGSNDSGKKLKHLEQYMKESRKYSVPGKIWKKLPDKDKQAVIDYSSKLPKMDNNKFKDRNQHEQDLSNRTPLGIHKTLSHVKAGGVFVKGWEAQAFGSK